MLLASLIDYAGLYPPAGLDMHAAVQNYLHYRAGKRAPFLGRFIVDQARLEEWQQAANVATGAFRLSVIVTPDADFSSIRNAIERGLPIESIEVKPCDATRIESLNAEIPRHIECYFEVPFTPEIAERLDAVARAGRRAKLRMGGVTPDAFPSTKAVVELLEQLAVRRLAFKGTAGLHHPMRSERRLTYAPDSISGTMHGFLNVLAATAILWNGGSAAEAHDALEERDAHAFRISPDAFAWRDYRWNVDAIEEMRHKAFVSFGSCSFEEPIAGLEALRWL